MKKKIERIAVLKEQMTALLDAASTEKRSLTADEKTQFDNLALEKGQLEVDIERSQLERSRNLIPSATGAIDRDKLFAIAATAIVNKRSVEGFGDAITDNGSMVIYREAGSTPPDTTTAEAIINDTTSANDLIPVTIGELIEPLEQGLILNKIGVKMQTGCVGTLVFPTLAAIEATIADENAELTDTKLSIGKITSTPKRVGVSIPVSRRAIHQSNQLLKGIVMKQIPMALSRVLNKWMFSPTLLTGASSGPFVKTTPNRTYTAANGIKFTDVVALETAVSDAGVDVTDGTAAYICSAKVYGALKSTPIASGNPKMILEDGKINGYPVYVTNYFKADSLGFGVFSYCAVGQFGGIELLVDPYTSAKSNIVNFVLNSDFDIVTARTEAFSLLNKA